MDVPYPYSPITSRPPLHWPNDARLAFWITPNIEVFRLGMPVVAQGVTSPSVSAYAARDYGNRVAIWRLMEVLERHGVRATVALNAEVCERTPEIIEQAGKLGWEFMGHGLTNSILLPDLRSEDEPGHIKETLQIISQATGNAPRGWLSAGLAETEQTLDLLVQNGVEYVCDWIADEQPFWMRTRSGCILSLPYAFQLNDIRIFADTTKDPEVFTRMVRRTFDTLYRESAQSARVLAISVHPFIIGLPHIIDALDDALAYILRHGDVWVTTGSEMMDWYRSQRPPAR